MLFLPGCFFLQLSSEYFADNIVPTINDINRFKLFIVYIHMYHSIYSSNDFFQTYEDYFSRSCICCCCILMDFICLENINCYRNPTPAVNSFCSIISSCTEIKGMYKGYYKALI